MNRQHSDAVVDLAAAAIASSRDVARAALDALAAAGLLLPEGAETRTEYAVRVDRPVPRRKEKAGDVMTHLCAETALYASKVWDGWTTLQRTVLSWPDGSSYVGAWTPVADPLAEYGRMKAAELNEQGADVCPVCLAPRDGGTCRWCPTAAEGRAVGDSKPSVQDPSVSVEETPQ